MTDRESTNAVAVLVSGGIDSAVLAVELCQTFDRVQPIYVRFGLRWEVPEIAGLRAFLDRIEAPRMAPLMILDEPIAAVYGDHWSVGGQPVPASNSPDEAVYLPGRNLLLITKTAIWCQLRGIGAIAMGSLASNPFEDGSPDFFRDLEATLERGLGDRIRLIRPFESLAKVDVMRRGSGLPLGLTFSCLDPVEGNHCGCCNKCGERRRAFHGVGLPDPTNYRARTADNHRGLACTE